MGVKDLRRRMILAPTPRERERWYAIVLLAQGLSKRPEALERDPHTIGRWASAFGAGGPAALIFEQTGGSPPPLTRRTGGTTARCGGHPTGQLVWRVVRQFVSERFGISRCRSSCLNWQPAGVCLQAPQKRLLKANESKREACVAEYAARWEEAQRTEASIFLNPLPGGRGIAGQVG